MELAVEENNPIAFRLALAAWDSKEDDRLANWLIDRNRVMLFKLFVERRTISPKTVVYIIQLDRATLLSHVKFPVDEVFRLSLIWECFQNNAPNCFEVSLRGIYITNEAIQFMNEWLYTHTAHRLVEPMIARRLFRPECIRAGLLQLRNPAWTFMQTLRPFIPYFDSPELLVEMAEHKNVWFIKFYATQIRSVCRDNHTLFNHFKNAPDICMHLRAFCGCKNPWTPNDFRIEIAANWQFIQDFDCTTPPPLCPPNI